MFGGSSLTIAAEAQRQGDSSRLRNAAGDRITLLPEIGAAGFQTVTTWIASIDFVTPVNPLSNPYPGGLLQPPTSEAEDLWSFGVQREIPRECLLEAVYAGTQGVRLPMTSQYNQVDPQYQSLGNELTRRVPNPFYALINTGVLSTPTAAAGYSRRRCARTLPDVRGPARRNYNMALSKTTAITERV